MDELRSVVKWRVTTDDSMEVAAGGIQSRNGGMMRDDWAETKFSVPQTLAEPDRPGSAFSIRPKQG